MGLALLKINLKNFKVLLEQFASQSAMFVSENGTGLMASNNGTMETPVVQEMERVSSSQLYYEPPGCLLNHSCPYGLMNYFQVF
jgi:hypothetical protein